MSRFTNNTNSSNITIYFKKNSESHNNFNSNVNGIDIENELIYNTNMLSIVTQGDVLEVKSHLPYIGYFSYVVNDDIVSNISSSSQFINNYSGSTINGLEINSNLSIEYELFVKNNITAFSTNVTSDINLKYDINNIVDGLEIINKLKPVRYKWKKDNKDMIGFIAQDVEEVLPITVKNYDNFKVINENKIIPYLVNSIKNINKRLNEHRRSHLQ